MEYTISNRMSALRGSAIREIFKYAADPSVISLAGGNPAPELFPHEALADIAAEVLREQPITALQYGITEGYVPLREAIKSRIQKKDADLVGNMASEGTTPRRLTDLIGSLCDLTSGSGDKGTPIVYIQGYFDNYTTE